ncbi:MAG: thiamine phosphate synthase [Chitinophagales bacterium]
MSEKKDFKLIIMSTVDGFEHEISHVQKMFEEGLELFHLRKPKFSTRKLRHYLEKMGSKYHQRIVIHSHHELSARFHLRGIHYTQSHRKKNFLINWFRLRYVRMRKKDLTLSTGLHTIGELKEYDDKYDYVFLSPVFESISKVGPSGKFNEDSLREGLSKTSYQVIAMGGIDDDKIEKAKKLGFSGVAVLGSIWKSKEPVEKFKRIQERCQQLVKM